MRCADWLRNLPLPPPLPAVLWCWNTATYCCSAVFSLSFAIRWLVVEVDSGHAACQLLVIRPTIALINAMLSECVHLGLYAIVVFVLCCCFLLTVIVIIIGWSKR